MIMYKVFSSGAIEKNEIIRTTKKCVFRSNHSCGSIRELKDCSTHKYFDKWVDAYKHAHELIEQRVNRWKKCLNNAEQDLKLLKRDHKRWSENEGAW